MDNIVVVGLILVLGIIANSLSRFLHLPNVFVLILLGIVTGPSLLALIDADFLTQTTFILDIALSFIAFMIGGSLKISRIKNLGKTIFSISLFQAEGTFIFTTALLYFLLPIFIENSSPYEAWIFYLILSMMLGAIATATAPGAVLATIHQVRAKGRFTTTLLAVVAVDDSLALFNFIMVTAVASILIGVESSSITDALWGALTEILFALMIGAALAWFLVFAARRLKTKNAKVTLALGVMILAYGSAVQSGLDGLLASMVLGVLFANYSECFDRVYDELSRYFEESIFILFFVLSGAHLHLETLYALLLMALTYIAIRAFGKILGSYIGAVLAKEDESVKKYMGVALLPQAGVSVGLALTIPSMAGLESIGIIVLSLVIATTALNELVGPLLVRYALKKAGDFTKEKR